MNDSSSAFPFSKRLVDEATALLLESRLDSILRSLHHEYFSWMSKDDFFRECVFHESLVMKQAALRFLSTDVAELLRRRVTDVVNSVGIQLSLADLLFHPIFYARLSLPKGENLSPDEPFFDSQPHYDRSFNVYARSVWLALRDVCHDTGGLCFFKDSSDVTKEFYIPWGEKNKYNYDLYVADHARLDAVLVPQVIHPSLKSGEAYFFDSHTLHAATKPISRCRVSFDFRVYIKSDLRVCDCHAKSIFDLYSQYLEISNSMNLLTFGDLYGALDVFPGLESFLGMSGSCALRLFSRYVSTVPGQKISWRDEYAFLNNPVFNTRFEQYCVTACR